MISPLTKNKIESIVNCFETSSITGNYAALAKLNDGPGNIKQITYGRSQTTEFGNLRQLLEEYMQNGGQFANGFQSFINRVGRQPSLCTDSVFCSLLKNAGKNDPLMKKSQDDFFDTVYYAPASAWFNHMGFTLPLSMLVIYDSHIHSGSIPGMLRNRFPEKVPVNGGDEKQWIIQYVDVRHQWLANHSRKILRGTIYRTRCFKDQLQQNNWDLLKPVKANGIVVN